MRHKHLSTTEQYVAYSPLPELANQIARALEPARPPTRGGAALSHEVSAGALPLRSSSVWRRRYRRSGRARFDASTRRRERRKPRSDGLVPRLPGAYCSAVRWPPTHEDRAAWSAVGGVLCTVAVGLGVAAVSWPLVAALAIVGVGLMLAPLLRLGPWHQEDTQALPPGVRAGHAIRAGGDIDAASQLRLATRSRPAAISAHLPELSRHTPPVSLNAKPVW